MGGGVLCCGVVWCGVVRCGVVWCGVWCGVVRCGVMWRGVACCGVVWCGMVRVGWAGQTLENATHTEALCGWGDVFFNVLKQGVSSETHLPLLSDPLGCGQ